MQSKFTQENYQDQQLDEQDTDVISEEAKLVYFQAGSLLLTCKSIFFCCKKDQRWHQKEIAIDRFENSLDIRSIVNLNTNLSILLKLIFNSNQQLLFFNQHDRAHMEDEKTIKDLSQMNLNRKAFSDR